MADGKIKGITIQFNGETTKLNKAMKQIKSSSKEIDKELQAVNKSLKFNPNNTVLLSQKQQLLGDKIRESKTQLEQFEKAQAQLKANGVEENSAEWRSLEREIVEAQSKVKYFQSQLDSLNSAKVTTLAEKLDKAGDKMKSAGKKMASVGAGASITGAGFVVMGKKFVESAQAQLEVEDKLTEAYKAHVKGGEDAAKATMEYASALQQQGVVGDEVTLAGAGMLANYTDSADKINKLLPVMDNLLVKQKGYNATQSDAEAMGKSLGKALAGNASAFTKLGVALSDEEKKQFTAMNESERMMFIIKKITDVTGQMNAEFANTDLGQLQQAKNTIGDFSEEMGKVLLPAIADIAKWLSQNLLPKIQEFFDMAEKHPIIGKVAVGITGILVVGGPLLTFIGTLITVVGALLPLLGGLELGVLATVAPFIAIAAAIAGVIAIGVALYKHWDTVKEKAAELGGAIAQPFKDAWTILKYIVRKIKGLFPFKVKLPHFGIKPSGWKASDLLKGSMPTLGVNWYKTGGIFSSPSVIGVGEGASSEAVVPLDKFWAQMDNMTASIVQAIQLGMSGMGSAGAIDVTVELGGAKVGEKIVEIYDRTKKAVG